MNISYTIRQQSFEERLFKNSQDPLQTWVEYTTWSKSNLPAEEHTNVLKRACRSCFKFDKYKTSYEYLQMAVRFATKHIKPVELLSHLKNHGFGVNFALL